MDMGSLSLSRYQEDPQAFLGLLRLGWEGALRDASRIVMTTLDSRL
jgi:hypothetical protein